MKLNKNGWGTIEMLLLTGGLLIALIIAIFFISKLYGSFADSIGNKQYMDLENKLEVAAKEYIDDMDIEVNGEYRITYSTLKNTNYIGELKDIDGNSCNGYVQITVVNNINYYRGYILCDNYQTTDY